MKREFNSAALSLLIITLILLCTLHADAQKKKNKENDVEDAKAAGSVTMEKIKAVCNDVPLEKKPRLTVARFNVTAPNAPRDQFGENLATMLSNSLLNVQCYRVLARLKDSSDFMGEQNFQKQPNVDKKTSVAKNKLMGANVVVTGEVIKYEATTKSVGIAPVKTTSNRALVGINITLINPETRETIDAQNFNIEKKTSSGVRVGVTVPLLGNLDIASSAFNNPAVQEAVDQLIQEAVEYIAGRRDKVPMPDNAIADDAVETTVTIENIGYSELSAVSSAMEKIQGVSSVNSDDYANKKANIVVVHNLKTKDLVDKIMQAASSFKLGVKSVNKDAIVLAVE